MDDLDSLLLLCLESVYCLRRVVASLSISTLSTTTTALSLPCTSPFIPVCLSFTTLGSRSLANETQGEAEVCSVYNLSESVVAKYVNSVRILNLHSNRRVFFVSTRRNGAVGVSKKYGKRSWARYPYLLGLSSIGALPNLTPRMSRRGTRSSPTKDAVIDRSMSLLERVSTPSSGVGWP